MWEYSVYPCDCVCLLQHTKDGAFPKHSLPLQCFLFASCSRSTRMHCTCFIFLLTLCTVPPGCTILDGTSLNTKHWLFFQSVLPQCCCRLFTVSHVAFCHLLTQLWAEISCACRDSSDLPAHVHVNRNVTKWLRGMNPKNDFNGVNSAALQQQVIGLHAMGLQCRSSGCQQAF